LEQFRPARRYSSGDCPAAKVAWTQEEIGGGEEGAW
jgi:hypothetical protein